MTQPTNTKYSTSSTGIASKYSVVKVSTGTIEIRVYLLRVVPVFFLPSKSKGNRIIYEVLLLRTTILRTFSPRTN